MERPNNLDHSLPREVEKVVWRIVGNDESPLKQETTSRLIERTVRKFAKHLPSVRQDNAIAVVHGWFEFHEEKGWLKEDMRETVAYMIADGVMDALTTQTGFNNSEIAFCAVGSIQPDVAVNIIGSAFSNQELDAFVDYAFNTLETLCDKDAVLEADRHMRFEGGKTKVSLNHEKGGSRLENLLRLRDYEYRWRLNSSVANMVEFLVRLNPQHFYTLVERIDDPLMHLRAARNVIDQYTSSGQHRPSQWLTNGSTDALVALAIIHILWDVNSLDSEFRRNTEHGRERDDLEPTIFGLLSSMVEQLEKLEPVARARWVCELLSSGISVLQARGGSEKPARVKQLEELCIKQLERLVQQSWSEELLDEFRIGMCLTPLVPRTLPLAYVAFNVRETEATQSGEIAQLILDAHLHQVAEILDRKDSFYYDMSRWSCRDWVDSLGISLLLSDEEFDLAEWISEGCRALPLSAWDAEEDYERFLIAERVAQFPIPGGPPCHSDAKRLWSCG